MTMQPPHVPIPVPDVVQKRLWDYLVQAVADAFERRGYHDFARRVEALRASPNISRIMSEAVYEGWAFWLDHTQHPAVVAAVRREYQERLPTLIRLPVNGALARHITRDDVERELARCFRELPGKPSREECRLAATELTDMVFHAALDKPDLRSMVQAAVFWEQAHQSAKAPKEHFRARQVHELARQRAKHEGTGAVMSAHVLYGVAALLPMTAAQRALQRQGVTDATVALAIPRLGTERVPMDSRHGPADTTGATTIFGSARAIAWEERAVAYDDHHILRSILALASDPACGEGTSLRALFAMLSVNIPRLANEYAASCVSPGANLTSDPGVLLSFHGL